MDNRSSGPYFVDLIYRNVPVLKQSTFRNVYKYFVLFLTFVIYVAYHLSRKPLSVVKNQLSPCSDVNITSQNCTGGWEPFNGSDGKEMLGALDSCYLFTYAFFMFISGHIAERMNLRYFLFFGMLLSGISTSLFGFGRIWAIHSFWYFAVVQVFSGIVQSSGWPPVVACVANWFGKGKRGFIMGIWNSHTSVGNILGSVIAGAMVNQDWACSFIIPGLIIFTMGCFVFLLLIPHPHDLQPNTNYSALIDPDHQEVNGDNGYQEERVRLINDDEIDTANDAININQSQASFEQEGGVSENDGEPIGFFKAILIPGVIEFSLCLFFAKLVSYTFLFWLPYYISKTGNYDPTQAADMSALFDVGGILGGIVAGIASDYHGGRALTCMMMLLIAAPSMFIYYFFGGISFGLSVFLLMLCGFFVNGPYSLITTAVSADLGTHPSLKGDSKALSTVTAIIDGTGSIGAAVGPLVTGLLSSYGWDYVFYMLIISDVIALLVSVYVYFVIDSPLPNYSGKVEAELVDALSWQEKWQLAWSKSNRWLLILPNLQLLLGKSATGYPNSSPNNVNVGGAGSWRALPRYSCCSLSPYKFRVSLGQWLGTLFAILFFTFVYLFFFNHSIHSKLTT